MDSVAESIKFFEFSYLVPSKIVNSCAITLNIYIKNKLPHVSEEKRLKFIRNIINVHFSKHAPTTIRAEYFKREIYCAGLYNSTPIFQWYTPSDNSKEYYSENDIKKYRRIFLNIFRNSKNIYFIDNKIPKNFDINNYINNPKEMIENIPLIYVSDPYKLTQAINENYKKTFKDYIKLPFIIINTLFVATITKFTLK